MKKIRFYHGLGIVSALFLLPALGLCAQLPIKVQVSILPQQYFVEQIGKDRVQVEVLVKPGRSPEIYSPSPDQIRNLMGADVYFRIGVDFENGIIDRLKTAPGLKIVDTREGIALRDMTDVHAHDHSSGHGHAGKDPHVWLNPANVKIMARKIFQTLCDLDPAGRRDFQQGYESFIRDLDRLDQSLKDSLAGLRGQYLFVFHPAFGYFTDQYGLKQMAVETMGKSPKGKALSALIKLAREKNARVIFVQPQFDKSSAEKIASAIDGAVIAMDPLAYDYPANMNHMARTIAEAFAER